MNAVPPPEPGWGGNCSGAEPFALRVLGDEMAPEFRHGDIAIVEPDGALRDGSFVIAMLDDGQWALRQLVRRGQGWALRRLNPPEAAEWPLADLAAVRGVVIQKAVPGRRRESRFYV